MPAESNLITTEQFYVQTEQVLVDPQEQQTGAIEFSGFEEAEYLEAYQGFLPEVTTQQQIEEAFTTIEGWHAQRALQQALQIRQGIVRPVTDAYTAEQARVGAKAREAHHAGVPLEVAEHYEVINNSLYFNQVTGESGQRTNLNVNTDPAGEVIRHRVKEVLEQTKVVCVLPFVDKEEPTIEGNTEYALEMLGEGRVLAVHAGRNRELEDRVREKGGLAVNQDDVLRCMNWEGMVQLGILPPYFPMEEGLPAKGPNHRNMTKGLTMLAGALTMEAFDMLEDHDVAYHDTDITNPKEYDALTHLYIPHTYARGQEVTVSRIARNGQGRNNEIWQAAANQIGTEAAVDLKQKFLDPTASNPEGISDDEFYRRVKGQIDLSTLMGNNTWPLTGERTGKVYDLIFSTGMGIETQADLHDAGIDVRNKDNTVAQTGNPNPKIENAESETSREFMLINYCANYQKQVAEHIMRTGRMLHEWTVDDIRTFNNMYADLVQTFAVPNEAPNAAPARGLAPTEYMIPSIKHIRQLEEEQGISLVDWDKMREVFMQQNKGKTLRRVA